jgi:hypothetical protein
VWRTPEPGSSRRLSQLSRQRPLEASRDAERPNLPCCLWKSRHEAARGLKRGDAIGVIPSNRAAKSPSFPKSRALPINRTYSLCGARVPPPLRRLPMRRTYFRIRGTALSPIFDRFPSANRAKPTVGRAGKRQNPRKTARSPPRTDSPDILAWRSPACYRFTGHLNADRSEQVFITIHRTPQAQASAPRGPRGPVHQTVQ